MHYTLKCKVPNSETLEHYSVYIIARVDFSMKKDEPITEYSTSVEITLRHGGQKRIFHDVDTQLQYVTLKQLQAAEEMIWKKLAPKHFKFLKDG